MFLSPHVNKGHEFLCPPNPNLRAVQDAKVTWQELESIERECSQAMAQLAALLEAVRQLYKNRGKPLKAVAGD